MKKEIITNNVIAFGIILSNHSNDSQFQVKEVKPYRAQKLCVNIESN